MLQAHRGLGLDLSDALPSDFEANANLFERQRVGTAKAETQSHDLFGFVAQLGEHVIQGQAQMIGGDLLERVKRTRVADAGLGFQLFKRCRGRSSAQEG